MTWDAGYASIYAGSSNVLKLGGHGDQGRITIGDNVISLTSPLTGTTATFTGTLTAPAINASGTGMSTFATNMSSNDDWQNSPITIRERGMAGAGDAEDRDSPNLNFHWLGRISNSLWMNSAGALSWGSYSGTGVPSANGIFRAGAYQVGGTTVIDTSRNLSNIGSITAGGTITGNLNVNGVTTLGNGPSDQTHINDTLYLGATDSGDSHFYFGENSSSWYGDHWYWDSGYGVERYSRYAGTDSLIEKHDTRYTHKVQTNRAYERLSHSTGYQIGSYNTQGDNSAKTNPIYTIGDNYRPADTTLGNMYGIGFASNSTAAFLSGDLDAGADGWGLYVAADGDARIFLGASNGTIKSTGQHYANGSVVWNAGNDGSGTGLDADLLDGIQGASFLRSDAADTATGKITFNAGIDGQAIFLSGAQNFDALKQIGFYSLYNANASGHTNAPFQYGAMISSNSNAGGGMGMQFAHERTGSGTYIRGMNDTADTWYPWREVWTSGTDGSGSGLDADLLDGQHGSYYYAASNPSGYTTNTGTTDTSHAVTGSAFATTGSLQAVF